LKARGLAQLGFDGVGPAFDLLKDGRERWPADPRIAADLAALILKFAFAPIAQSSKLAAEFSSVSELVETALVGAPELAESHVAAGNLQLYVGDPVVAAREFRTAIALSPYQSEPHEGLGRLLLEAGFLDDAIGRLDDALAIAPGLSSVRWEIARAHALEQSWQLCDRLVATLREEGDRPVARFRFALWRGDRERMMEARERWNLSPNAFEPKLMATMFSVGIDGTWERDRAQALELVMTSGASSKRSRGLVAQVIAEISGFAGDTETCLAMLARAVQFDMFDRHWFDRCPTLAAARATPEGRRLQQVVTRRAEAILDALYGDDGSSSDTISRPSSRWV
jgi:eukaryotic-like serine/threonine-protein kinase